MTKAIVLEIDSPGGQSYECAETAEAIRASKKPVLAYVSGEASSAAYWLACSANRIMAHRSAYVGSIGTYCYIYKNDGEGKYIVSSLSPDKVPDLDLPESVEKVRAHMDDMTRIFVDDIARYRNTTSENVLSNWGKGDILMSEKALLLGMIDVIGNYNYAYATAMKMAEEKTTGGINMKKGIYAVSSNALAPHAESIEFEEITVDFLKEEMPELVEEIAEMARKEYESKMAETEEVAAMADEKDDDEREAAKSFRKGEIGERAFMQRLLDIRAKRKGSNLADVANDKELAGIHANAGQNNVPVNNAFMSEFKKIRNIRG
jgi:ClpP class serine protease